ncbi:MAG: cryptochrome/photolyase family protein [Planctomycetota bacterium]|nr:MAG: cryptochrome/photolyase family protein [Planctomycetota bacterium]REK37826.1 MAG: cryptochrome/photolyase family protein [Planctomycetota bacterium]
MRNLILILGDQLDHSSEVFRDFDPDQDAVWMAEVEEEATHVWCHKLRIACFFSAMRHFRDEIRGKDRTVHYHELQRQRSRDRGRSFAEILQKDAARLKPERLVAVRPGDYRVQHSIQKTADDLGLELALRPDAHFYCSPEEFQDYAKGRKSLILEYFYREMRKRHGVLVDEEGEPTGGQWNYDRENRESFGREGPADLPKIKTFEPDAITRDVLKLVESRFSDHPGRLDHFTLPVTRKQAQAHLWHFIKHGLPDFGRWEDAMWTDEPFLYHSQLSAPLNLKLLNPRECVTAAVAEYEEGRAPLNSVEGFVRQVLGWREFIRGVYWLKMPEYIELNALQHTEDLPSFFWDGETEMNCVRQSMQHVLNHGYSHHIHRLMVLGNFAQLWGVHPRKFHEWHMAMYLDAVDWVSLPNTLGMSQFGDGGIVGTKPYCSSGNYINKMSNFCRDCRFDYRERTGDDACPFTTLYWEFLDRHSDRLQNNHRMNFALANLERLKNDSDETAAIHDRAEHLRSSWSLPKQNGE